MRRRASIWGGLAAASEAVRAHHRRRAWLRALFGRRPGSAAGGARAIQRVVFAGLVAWLIAPASACTGGGRAAGPPPAQPVAVPRSADPTQPVAAPRSADPAPAPPGRAYIPPRCRDEEGNATSGCRPRRIVSTSTSIELLEAVAFAGDTVELAPSSYRMLDRVAHTLIANPNIRVIEVRGRIDAQPGAAERAGLAQRRAEVVAAYLVAQGVAESRLTTRGVLGAAPRASPDGSWNHQVEFRILASDE